MSVLLHQAVKGETKRLETLLAAATADADVELIRCALADLISCAAQIRRRLDDQWLLEHPRWAKQETAS